MDSDSVLLGSVVVPQRPFTAPTGPGTSRQPANMQWMHQPFPVQQLQQGAKAQSAPGEQPNKVQLKLPVFPKATLAAVAGIQRAASEPGVALRAAAAAAAASPAGFKFGLNTVERRVLSCNGSNAAPEAASTCSSIQQSMLGIDRGGMVRFGSRMASEPHSAFDIALAGAESSDDGGSASGIAQQKIGQHQGRQQQPHLGLFVGELQHQGSRVSSSTNKPAVGGTVHVTPAIAEEAGCVSDASDDYENDFEDYELEEAVEADSESLKAEVEQRKRIMETIADLSK